MIAAAWPLLPVGVVLAVLASLFVPRGSAPAHQARGTLPGSSVEEATGGPGQAGYAATYLPEALAYIAPTIGGHGRLGLFMSSGVLPGRPIGLDEIGEPASVEFSPDGGHQAVLDVQGRMIVLPERRVVPGPVKGIAFSPEGDLLAACSAGAWPPRITIYPLGQADGQSGPSFPGGEPEWSGDGRYLAYRVPADSAADAPHAYDPREFEVLNTHLNLRFSVRGTWPVAWATAPGYSIRPLTVTALDGRSVDLVDPRGGGRRTLVSAETLRSLAGGRPLGRITLLAWSPDGDRLAIAFDPSSAGATEVIDVEPRTGRGVALEETYGVWSFTWSENDDLLIETAGPGRGRTTLVRGLNPVDPAFMVRDASWSADGRWFLAQSMTSLSGHWSWVVMGTANLQRVRPVPDSASWVFARWCCPPVPVVTGPPAPGP